MVSRKEFMKEQLRLLTSLETKMDELNAKRKESIDLSKLTKKELREQVKLEEYLNTRTRILSATQKLNNDQFNLGIKTFQDYRKAGGTSLEYLATFMTGTSEKVKILGFEAQAVRRVIYGFMPPGMFRMVNKVASVFNGLGSSFRAIRDGAKDSNNFLTTTVKLIGKMNPLSGGKAEKGLLAFFGGKSKELKEIEATLKGDKKAQLLGKIGLDPQTRKDQEKRRDELKGQQSEGFRDNIKGRLKSLPEMGIMSKLFKKSYDTLKDMKNNPKEYYDSAIKHGKRIGNMAKIAFRPMMTFLVMAMFYLAIVSAIVVVVSKTIKEAWKFASGIIKPFIFIMTDALKGIWEGLSDVFNGIINGDLNQILNGVLEIGLGVLQFVFGLALAAVVGLGALVFKMITVGGKKLFNWLGKSFSSFKNFKKNFGKILLFVVILVGLFVGWPAALVVLIIGLIPKFIQFLVSKIKGLFDFFNTGGTATGNMSIVGESGPELVKLPIGSRVKNNHVSKRTASSNRGGNTINITINAKDTSDAEMRRIAEKVGRLVNNSINRNTGMSGIR
tara:strand:+ start:2936 stop:4606 length:1671 start_codon:yes stop_codon:yes gene_type:complete